MNKIEKFKEFITESIVETGEEALFIMIPYFNKIVKGKVIEVNNITDSPKNYEIGDSDFKIMIAVIKDVMENLNCSIYKHVNSGGKGHFCQDLDKVSQKEEKEILETMDYWIYSKDKEHYFLGEIQD